jgi:hypothetical protein
MFEPMLGTVSLSSHVRGWRLAGISLFNFIFHTIHGPILFGLHLQGSTLE